MNLYKDLIKKLGGYLSNYDIIELAYTINEIKGMNSSYCALNVNSLYDKNIYSLKKYFENNFVSHVVLREEDAYMNVNNSEFVIRECEDYEHFDVCWKIQITDNKTLNVTIKSSVDELKSISRKILSAYRLYLHAANLKTKLEFIEYDKDDDGFFYDDFMNIKTTKILNRQDILDEKIASLKNELETTTEETAKRMYSDVFLKNAIELLKAEKTYHKNISKNMSAEWYISKLLEEAETITKKQGFDMYTKGYYLRLKINKAAEESIAKEIAYNDFGVYICHDYESKIKGFNDFGTTFDNEE